MEHQKLWIRLGRIKDHIFHKNKEMIIRKTIFS
jgi:hypothetical protein